MIKSVNIVIFLPLSTRDSFASIAENRYFILVLGGQFFVPHCPFGGQYRDKNTEKICKYTENMKKKRKYVILSYMLIYSKLMLYFFSFYNFLFFRLLAAGEKCEDPVGVHSKSIIRINVKGSAVRLSGKIGVTDTQIDYHSSEVTASPQPDGTRVLFHQVNGQKYLAGVEDQGNTMKKGVVMFRVLGDGRELYSQKMASGEKMKSLEVDIRKVKQLELRVDDGGDGPSGDFAVWSGVRIDSDNQLASAESVEAMSGDEGVSQEDWNKMAAKLKDLPVADYPFMKRSATDWLLTPETYKAEVKAGSDGKSLVLTNGLTARVFRITPNLATVDIVNQMSGENMLRAVSGEGELVINGQKWYLGGLEGQPERGYLKMEWLDDMSVRDSSFIVEDFYITDSVRTLDWARSRWALNKQLPTGKSLTFGF
ncbi:hypothetical protein BACCOPRO_01741, partial [Phocaeicola coprophilus DSM 18228 = JCM 13818]